MHQPMIPAIKAVRNSTVQMSTMKNDYSAGVASLGMSFEPSLGAEIAFDNPVFTIAMKN